MTWFARTRFLKSWLFVLLYSCLEAVAGQEPCSETRVRLLNQKGYEPVYLSFDNEVIGQVQACGPGFPGFKNACSMNKTIDRKPDRQLSRLMCQALGYDEVVQSSYGQSLLATPGMEVDIPKALEFTKCPGHAKDIQECSVRAPQTVWCGARQYISVHCRSLTAMTVPASLDLTPTIINCDRGKHILVRADQSVLVNFATTLNPECRIQVTPEKDTHFSFVSIEIKGRNSEDCRDGDRFVVDQTVLTDEGLIKNISETFCTATNTPVSRSLNTARKLDMTFTGKSNGIQSTSVLIEVKPNLEVTCRAPRFGVRILKTAFARGSSGQWETVFGQSKPSGIVKSECAIRVSDTGDYLEHFIDVTQCGTQLERINGDSYVIRNKIYVQRTVNDSPLTEQLDLFEFVINCTMRVAGITDVSVSSNTVDTTVKTLETNVAPSYKIEIFRNSVSSVPINLVSVSGNQASSGMFHVRISPRKTPETTLTNVPYRAYLALCSVEWGTESYVVIRDEIPQNGVTNLTKTPGVLPTFTFDIDATEVELPRGASLTIQCSFKMQ